MKTLEETLKENKERTTRLREERLKRYKIERIKEQALFTIIALFIVFITLHTIAKMDNRSLKNCMEQGYSENVCRKGL